MAQDAAAGSEVLSSTVSATAELAAFLLLLLAVVARWWRRRLGGTARATDAEVSPWWWLWARGGLDPADARRLPEVRRKVDAAQRGGALNLGDVPLRKLPESELVRAANRCQRVTLHASAHSFRLDPLRRLPLLESVTVKSSAVVVPRHWLDALGALPALKELDLSGCRVKDSNNSAAGLCSGADLFACSGGDAGRRLRRFAVPALAAVRVGTVVKVFPKAWVAVVRLTRPLRVGDAVELRRVEHTFAGGSAHHWASRPTTVTSMRDREGNQLADAAPARAAVEAAVDGGGSDDDDDDDGNDDGNDGDVASQFAVKLREIGKKGDGVFWLGHGLDTSATRP